MSDMHAIADYSCSLDDDLDTMHVDAIHVRPSSPLDFFSEASPPGIDSEVFFNWEPEPELDRAPAALDYVIAAGHNYHAMLDAENALHAPDNAGTSVDIGQTAAATDMRTDMAAPARQDYGLAGWASPQSAPAAKGNGRGKPARAKKCNPPGSSSTGSRGGGRKASEAGMLFKAQFREKYSSNGEAYRFRPSASYQNYFRKITLSDFVESEISAMYDAMPLHLTETLRESNASAFNHIKISAEAKRRLIEAFMASARSMANDKDVKATWQRITQILADLGFLAVKGCNTSGRGIFSGNSDFHFSIEAWNENGHRCCPGGRARINPKVCA